MRLICINIQRISWNMVCCICLGLEVMFFSHRKGQWLGCSIAMPCGFSFPQNSACVAKDASNVKKNPTLSDCCSLIFHTHSTNQQLEWGVLYETNKYCVFLDIRWSVGKKITLPSFLFSLWCSAKFVLFLQSGASRNTASQSILQSLSSTCFNLYPEPSSVLPHTT